MPNLKVLININCNWKQKWKQLIIYYKKSESDEEIELLKKQTQRVRISY